MACRGKLYQESAWTTEGVVDRLGSPWSANVFGVLSAVRASKLLGNATYGRLRTITDDYGRFPYHMALTIPQVSAIPPAHPITANELLITRTGGFPMD
ncbi:hypothetical protein AVEN_261037-1 [Araneus ventricosus]|uniref:Uncharacterized protein n=1 Tax=Araneus ventricosus TaxID=182803 RepID=A0A4Y2MUK1_ARAVE|nr:hypothetical protein AVEN_261037-1 [Araneus ventricosus]